MSKKKINETASAGATSAGAIASNVSCGLNYPLHKRLPPTNLFGYKEYDIDKETKKKKR